MSDVDDRPHHFFHFDRRRMSRMGGGGVSSSHTRARRIRSRRAATAGLVERDRNTIEHVTHSDGVARESAALRHAAQRGGGTAVVAVVVCRRALFLFTSSTSSTARHPLRTGEPNRRAVVLLNENRKVWRCGLTTRKPHRQIDRNGAISGTSSPCRTPGDVAPARNWRGFAAIRMPRRRHHTAKWGVGGRNMTVW